MSKNTSSSADYADYPTFPTLFELEPVAGKKVTVDFTAPELFQLGRLTLVREYEKSSSRIIFRGDSHFCSHDFMDWVTDHQDGIHFITGLAGNAKLKSISERWHQFRLYLHCAAIAPSCAFKSQMAPIFWHIRQFLLINPCGYEKIPGTPDSTSGNESSGYE